MALPRLQKIGQVTTPGSDSKASARGSKYRRFSLLDARVPGRGVSVTPSDGYSIAKGFIIPVTAPDAIGKGIPSKKWMKYDLVKHCWPQEEEKDGTLKIPDAPRPWIRSRRFDGQRIEGGWWSNRDNRQSACTVRLTSGRQGECLWTLKDIFTIVTEVNVRQGNNVEALPAGALVIVSGDGPDDRVQVVSDSDTDILLQRSALAPLQNDPRKTIRTYLKALPRGRKAPFGVLMPFCASELQFKHGIWVAHAAGIHPEDGWLTYEIMCAHSAAQLYPSRCKPWLASVVSHALHVGLPVAELFPSIAHSVDFSQMLPQPLTTLDKLPAGGLCPCFNAFQQLVSSLWSERKREDNVAHVQQLQEYLNCVSELLQTSTDVKAKYRVFPCQVSEHLQLHSNCTGSHIGFASFSAFKKLQKQFLDIFQEGGGHINIVKNAGWDGRSPAEEQEAEELALNLKILLENLQHIHHAHFDLISPSMPDTKKILKGLATIVEEVEGEYEELWKKEPTHDLKVVESLAFTKSDLWTKIQEDGDPVALYYTAWTMVPTMYVFTYQLMTMFNVQPAVSISVQSLKEQFEDLYYRDPLAFAERDFTGCTGILLARSTFTSLPLIAAVAEFVDENFGPSSTYANRKDMMGRLGLPPGAVDQDIRLVHAKNSFSNQATGGHRCVVLVFSLGGFIAKLRLEYSKCQDIRSKHGKKKHDWVKAFRQTHSTYIGESHIHECEDTGNRIWERLGFGVQRELDGSLYVGEWVDDMRHGDGTLFDTSGNIFQGEFHRGEREGNGTIWFLDGTVWKGQFHHDQIRGKSLTWVSNGAVEVMDHTAQLRGIFNKDRTKATLELLGVVSKGTKDGNPESGGESRAQEEPKSAKQPVKRGEHSRQSVWDDNVEEECTNLGIARGEPKQEVTTWDACKCLGLDTTPDLQPPTMTKVRTPKFFRSQTIKQTQKADAPSMTISEMDALQCRFAFEEEFGIYSE